MRVPFLLFVFSVVACGAAVLLPGWADLLLIAAPSALASLFLLGRAWRRGAVVTRLPRLRRRAADRIILIDGSNVLHWRDNTPNIETLREVIAALTARGYAPAVVFDANAGYLISGKYQHDKALGDLLALPEDRVMVVQKGEPADPVLLVAARDIGARIVTNDRYRDWADAHPQVREPGFLVRGSYRGGTLWLDLDEMAVA